MFLLPILNVQFVQFNPFLVDYAFECTRANLLFARKSVSILVLVDHALKEGNFSLCLGWKSRKRLLFRGQISCWFFIDEFINSSLY